MTDQIKADIKSCGVIVFRNQPDLQFLLMQHADRWDLPKGHVDAGESEYETALRELHEETGIRDKDLELDPHFRFSLMYTVKLKRFGGEPRQKELVIFLGKLQKKKAKVKLTEHIGYEWMDWNPPHQIQPQSIDPLLHAVDTYWARS
ncbi:MAG: bis(5'-nucleosyl)-tetraphosphatase [Pirellulaceae bacterium]